MRWQSGARAELLGALGMVGRQGVVGPTSHAAQDDEGKHHQKSDGEKDYTHSPEASHHLQVGCKQHHADHERRDAEGDQNEETAPPHRLPADP